MSPIHDTIRMPLDGVQSLADHCHIDQPCCTGWHGQGTSQLLGFHFLILSGSCCQMKTGTFSSPEFYTLTLLLFKITERVILPPGTSQEDLRL